MKNPHPATTVFYHRTDPQTAERILEAGFRQVEANGVRLFDQRPDPAAGEVMLRVALPADAAAELLKRGHAGKINGVSQYVAPVALLEHAYVNVINSPGDQGRRAE